MGVRNRRRDASGHVDPFFQRRARYEAALRPLGLWEGFARLPRSMQEHFWRVKNPDPVLEFDASVPSDGGFRELRQTIERDFRSATFTAGDVTMAARDFFSVLMARVAVIEKV